MAISRELYLAILAMDSYNRGYGQGVIFDGSTLGASTLEFPEVPQAWVDAGFYAISYTVGAGVDGIAAGTTVISYRGTDGFGSDVPYGWVASLGLPTSQVDLALDFYESVTGHTVYEGPQANVILTGHSLGGGLAGIASWLSGTSGVGFDHMPFGAVVAVLAAENGVTPSTSAFSGVYVTGEVLAGARAGYLQPIVGNIITKLLGFGLTLGAAEGLIASIAESYVPKQGRNSGDSLLICTPINPHRIPVTRSRSHRIFDPAGGCPQAIGSCHRNAPLGADRG